MDQNLYRYLFNSKLSGTSDELERQHFTSQIPFMDFAPESDFDTWASILVATLEPGGGYAALLPDFERLLVAYCENGALPAPSRRSPISSPIR
jgi:hypothetical protein